MEVDAQALINQLVAQRNAALDSQAQIAAILHKAQERIAELEKQVVKNDTADPSGE